MNKLHYFFKIKMCYRTYWKQWSFSIFIFIFSLFVFSCSSNNSIDYHKTNKIPVVDTYYDSEVIDNYRWLEDDLSQETGEWLKVKIQLRLII